MLGDGVRPIRLVQVKFLTSTYVIYVIVFLNLRDADFSTSFFTWGFRPSLLARHILAIMFHVLSHKCNTDFRTINSIDFVCGISSILPPYTKEHSGLRSRPRQLGSYFSIRRRVSVKLEPEEFQATICTQDIFTKILSLREDLEPAASQKLLEFFCGRMRCTSTNISQLQTDDDQNYRTKYVRF
jgi:hypothetical protein